MLSLTKKLKRNSTAPEKAPEQRTRSVKESLVKPSGIYHVGRRLAVQIDDDAIQLVASNQRFNRIELIAVESVDFRDKHLGPAEKAHAASNTIRDFVDKHGARRARTTVVISGRETVYRTFAMPLLKRGKLRSALEFEARRQVPFPLDDCQFDYRPLYQLTGGANGSYRVALHAATKRMIQQRLEIFEAIDVTVDEIVYGPDVVGTLVNRLSDTGANEHFTMVAIHSAHSEISFYRKSNLEFLHISSTGANVLGGQDDDTTLEYFAELLASEIQTSIDYYTGQISRIYSERVALYGPLCDNHRLLGLLSEKSGLLFDTFPISKLDLNYGGAVEPGTAVCQALPVVAGAINSVSLPSLLPPQQKRELANQKRANHGRNALIVVVALLLGTTAVLWNRRASEQEAMLRIDEQIREFEQSPAYHTYNILKRRLANDQSYLDQIKESKSILNLDMKALSNLTPSSIQLTTMGYQPSDTTNNMVLTGTIKSVAIPPEVILAEYVETLNASPFFHDVQISRHVKKAAREGFTIEFQLVFGGVVS